MTRAALSPPTTAVGREEGDLQSHHQGGQEEQGTAGSAEEQNSAGRGFGEHFWLPLTPGEPHIFHPTPSVHSPLLLLAVPRAELQAPCHGQASIYLPRLFQAIAYCVSAEEDWPG